MKCDWSSFLNPSFIFKVVYPATTHSEGNGERDEIRTSTTGELWQREAFFFFFYRHTPLRGKKIAAVGAVCELGGSACREWTGLLSRQQRRWGTRLGAPAGHCGCFRLTEQETVRTSAARDANLDQNVLQLVRWGRSNAVLQADWFRTKRKRFALWWITVGPRLDWYQVGFISHWMDRVCGKKKQTFRYFPTVALVC